MTIPKSPAVQHALDLLRKWPDMTAYAAAKQTGCTSGAIYKSAEYKSLLAERASKEAAK